MANTMKYWKEAATLIIAARTKTPICSYLGKKKFSFDYQILMLQRTAKAGFFPSAQVFPGGQIDKADFNPEWLEIFKKYSNVHSSADFGRMVNVQGMRPPMLQRDHQSPVPIDVAYRICAIRETFEECGILMLRDASKAPDSPDSLPHGTCVATASEDLQHWRKKVHNDASSFLSLCQELGRVPDIWSLAEWSNWLTPSDITKRRFDTLFYISCLDHLPQALEDNTEIVQSKWVTPLESLKMFSNGETYLPPPQVYEFRRLLRFESFDRLSEFCRNRAFEGVQRYLPVRCDINDGVLSLLPGDELYPAEPILETGAEHRLERDEMCEDSMDLSRATNRFVFRGASDYYQLSTAPQACGQVSPMEEYIPAEKTEDSKL